jgi:NTP pyrophosphatase (non-canonical NTP hydrolase)
MELGEYQRQAWRFDQHQDDPDRGFTIALLGLGGEVGTLQTTQKKVVRDLHAHLDSQANATEDLGDILWYVADAATWLGVDLNDVAQANLKKIAERWPAQDRDLPQVHPRAAITRVAHDRRPVLGPAHLYDGRFPDSERLPRRLEVHLAEVIGAEQRVLPVAEGRPCGNRVSDNSYDEDGYRWHDCVHLAHLAILGWSPVIRALLKRKRKSSPVADDVEDGGRAIAVEEGITAMAFEAASRAGYYERSRVVDSDALRTCMRMVSNYEVSDCTPREWEQAILRGYDVWRAVREQGNGAITCDLDARTIDFRPLTTEELDRHAAIAEEFALA